MINKKDLIELINTAFPDEEEVKEEVVEELPVEEIKEEVVEETPKEEMKEEVAEEVAEEPKAEELPKEEVKEEKSNLEKLIEKLRGNK